jgi:hypothetical protein
MKKTILLAVVSLLFVVGLSAARARAYTQKVVALGSELPNQQFPDVVNGSTSSAPGFIVNTWITARPTEVVSTLTHTAAQCRLYRFGNGTAVPYDTRIFISFAPFPTDWAAGETLRVQVINNNVSPAKTDSYDMVIPDNLTSALTITNPAPELDLWQDIILTEPVVSISSISGNIQLSWNAVPGASSYRVEKCNDLSEPFTIVGSTNQLLYTETPTELSTFFRVVSASGDIESVPSAITGYVRYDLIAGYNCIALPLIQDTIFTSELSTLFDNNASTISVWNQTTQAWTTAVNYGGGFWDPDVSLSPGSVLLIYANSPISYYSIGLLPNSHAQYAFVIGDNAVMIPLNKSALTNTALSGITMGDGQAVNTISVWNPAIQGWESTVNFGNDYWDPIYSTSIGTPLFLNSYSIETWPLGPRTEPQSGTKR